MATILLAGVLYLTRTELSRLQFGYALVITLVLLLAVRYVVRTWHRLLGFRDQQAGIRILVIGAGKLAEQAATVLATYKRWGYRLIGFLDDAAETVGRTIPSAPTLGRIDAVEEIVKQHDIGDVWIALRVQAHEQVRSVVKRLAALPVRVHIVPDYFPLALISATPRDFGGLPVIALRDPVIVGMPRHVKRAFDILVSLSVLVLTAPILAMSSGRTNNGHPCSCRGNGSSNGSGEKTDETDFHSMAASTSSIVHKRSASTIRASMISGWALMVCESINSNRGRMAPVSLSWTNISRSSITVISSGSPEASEWRYSGILSLLVV